MALFEKVFQRNDKVFLQFYFFFLGIFLYICSSLAYYFGHRTLILPEDSTISSIVVSIIFVISGLIRLKEHRYIIGTAQFLRNELVVLIQTFLIMLRIQR